MKHNRAVPKASDQAVPLYDLAHARAGDKGERLNICLFAYDPADYGLLVEQVTAERVQELFGHRGAHSVRRYLLPLLGGMNFVIDGVLEGGVNGSLNLDGHGKSQSFRLLSLPVSRPGSP
ncbi:hypothetical protein [Celeribacter sp.]|uniref:AtuA-related protein n=1 Tax=Celeribacter sp. TaxID=1890673 RepID=UPI003A916AA2